MSHPPKANIRKRYARLPRAAWCAAAAAALVLQGCTSSGSPDGTQSNQAHAKSCPFATSEMVTTAFGAKITATESGTSGTGNAICSFTLGSTNLGAPGVVSLTLNTGASPEAFGQILRTAPGGMTVSDLGDAAFYIKAEHQLQVLDRNTVVIVDATVGAPAGPAVDAAGLQKDMTTLAATIVASL